MPIIVHEMLLKIQAQHKENTMPYNPAVLYKEKARTKNRPRLKNAKRFAIISFLAEATAPTSAEAKP